ncbi:MAG: hypothetical protein QXH07_06545 [Thermoplasmata archaeon]
MKANRRKKKYIPLRLQYDVTEGSRLRVHIKAVPMACHLPAISHAKRSRKRWSCAAYLLRKGSPHALAVGSTSQVNIP